MSADCALNIIPTGDYVDNAEWPQKSIFSISSSCDNRMPSTWYINETDEATQVTVVAAPMAADAGLQTIYENRDSTEKQHKICIHDLSKNINETYTTTRINECEDVENNLTKILRCETVKKSYRTDRPKTNNFTLQNDVQYKNFANKIEFQQCNDVNNIKMLKRKLAIRKKSSMDDYYNDNFVKENNVKWDSTNINNKMDEKLNRNIYKHIPHKDRPPLIVARRNARERRRVQAVNSAFMKLRKIIPIGNNRGKRISKVKTLQTAIDYINSLQDLLQQTDINDEDIIVNYRCYTSDYYRNLEDFYNEF